LKESSPENALQAYKKVCGGEDIASILRQLKDGDLLLQMAVRPDVRIRYEFPLVSGMPKTLLAPYNPYAGSRLYQIALEVQGRSQSVTKAARPRETRVQSSLHQIPYFAADLVEPRLPTLSISDWTMVSKDNVLLRKLLQSYFLYDYDTFAIFHRGVFLQAMREGDRRFCTPLLVNAVLAEACVGHVCGACEFSIN
jgi:hypothetical protein